MTIMDGFMLSRNPIKIAVAGGVTSPPLSQNVRGKTKSHLDP